MDVRVFETLADENRLAIIKLLAGGELCLCDVTARLGISTALASHHVKKLREADLVTTWRRGVWLHCRLNESALFDLSDSLRDIALTAAQPSPSCCGASTAEEAKR